MNAKGLAADIEALSRELLRIEQAAQSHAWCPHSPTPKQAEFLSLPALEALYGGAAGGGKSDAILADLLQYVEHPSYSAIAFRRTYTDLSLPDALMDRAAQWLRPTAAEWQERDKRWRFPSGATLTFGYLETERDKYRYQSARFHRVGFDELTQFTESQYTYLFSRIRRATDDGIPLGMRSATNPGGVGHEWVKRRFVAPGCTERPFIAARLQDNPHLDQAAYLESLARLDATTRAQLERGEWITDAGQLIYPVGPHNLARAEDCQLTPEDSRILAVDLGASETKPTTAFVLCGWPENEPVTWALHASLEPLLTPGQIAERIKAYQQQHDIRLIVVDEGALGRGYGAEFRDRYGIHTVAAEKRDKLGNRKLLRGELQEGRVKIVADGCGPLLDEMNRVIWDAAGLDAAKGQSLHCTDALLYGWRACRPYLARPKPAKPTHGTPEWYQAEEKRMLADEERELRDRLNAPWWRQRGKRYG